MLKLPNLVLLDDYNGVWDDYEKILYFYFQKDFLNNKLFCRSFKITIAREPKYKQKEACFWHLTSRGKEEKERIPDLRKCERIRWPKPIIENFNDENIKLWRNRRKGTLRICLCYGDWEYVVILLKKKKYVLFLTAYPIEHNHTKRKLQREYHEYIKKDKTAPRRDGIVTPSTHGR